MWSKRRTRTLQSVSQVMAALSEEATLELAIAGLWRRWEEVAGPELGKLLIPLGHQGRMMRVGAPHPAILQEASFLGPTLLHRANTLLGHPYFQEVRFELPGPRTALNQHFLPPPPPKPTTPCPTPIGGLQLPEDCPVGRAYRRYVTRVRATTGTGKEG